MHPPEIREATRALIASGLNDCEIARRTGLPRSTVREWRHGAISPTPLCPRCWRPARRFLRFGADDYCELLGLYLGDGHISLLGRTERLRISLDAKYPGVVGDTEALLRRCFPANCVGRQIQDRGATIVLWVYSSHLTCLFPQHAPGKKHHRRIALEPWQATLLRTAPWGCLRSCIRSDGCVFVNRTGRYEYLTYDFCNYSADIRDLFVEACSYAGVEFVCTPSGCALIAGPALR